MGAGGIGTEAGRQALAGYAEMKAQAREEIAAALNELQIISAESDHRGEKGRSGPMPPVVGHREP